MNPDWARPSTPKGRSPDLAPAPHCTLRKARAQAYTLPTVCFQSSSPPPRLPSHALRRGAVFALLAVLLSPAAGLAKPRGRVEFGAFGGLFAASDYHDLYDPSRIAQRPPRGLIGELGLRGSWLPRPFGGIEIELSAMPLAELAGERDPATFFAVRAHLLVQYPALLAPFIAVGGGALAVISSRRNSLGRDLDPAFHYGAGLKLRLARGTLLRFDLRHTLANRVGDSGIAHHVELLAGLSLAFGLGPRDSDGDGIPDARDGCPRRAGPASAGGCPDADHDGVPDHQDLCPHKYGSRALGGCPDADHDGVADREDRCPEQAGHRWLAGCPDLDGDDIADDQDRCPRHPGNLAHDGCPDQDNDGIPDPIDRCPRQAGPAATGGCPDSDGDGVADRVDSCPQLPGPPPSGCPDSDGDGIPDHLDACRYERETPNGYLDDDGCPDTIPPAIAAILGEQPEIAYARGGHRLLRRSLVHAEKVVRALRANPRIKILIRGRGDEASAGTSNHQLGLARANALRAYLFGKGVAFVRIKVQSTDEGPLVVVPRQKNKGRRHSLIELRLAAEGK